MSPAAQVVIKRTYKAKLEDLWKLWTTKEGFESWWGPQGFRVQVSALDANVGGTLAYAMIAHSPEMIAAMKAQGQPLSHGVTSIFKELKPMTRLVLSNHMDFIPGVEPYDADIIVDFTVEGGNVTMVTTLGGLHDDEFNGMQKEGYTSQLSKLDDLFQ